MSDPAPTYTLQVLAPISVDGYPVGNAPLTVQVSLEHFEDTHVVAEVYRRELEAEFANHDHDHDPDEAYGANELPHDEIERLADLIAEGRREDALDLLYRLCPMNSPRPATTLFLHGIRTAPSAGVAS